MLHIGIWGIASSSTVGWADQTKDAWTSSDRQEFTHWTRTRAQNQTERVQPEVCGLSYAPESVSHAPFLGLLRCRLLQAPVPGPLLQLRAALGIGHLGGEGARTLQAGEAQFRSGRSGPSASEELWVRFGLVGRLTEQRSSSESI